FRSGIFIQSALPSSYSCTFTFSPFAPRSLPASSLLRAVRLPQKEKQFAGLPGSSAHLSPRAASNHPEESDGCFTRCSTTDVRLHPLRQTGHSQKNKVNEAESSSLALRLASLPCKAS